MYEAAALAATKSMVAVALYKLMVSEYKIDVSLEKKNFNSSSFSHISNRARYGKGG